MINTRFSVRHTPHNSRRRAYGLVETSISVIIVSGMMVAALNAAGASRVAQRISTDGAKGSMLAASLMSEILEQKYVEPTETPVFGPEATELVAANRTVYDDVDDYDGLSNSPPKNRDGTDVPNCTGWVRSASVAYVDPNNLATTSITDTGVKRITVTVSHNNAVVKTLTGLKTNHSTILGDDGDGEDGGN